MSRYWRHVKAQRAGLGALVGLVSTTVVRGVSARWSTAVPRRPVLGTSVRCKVRLPDVTLQRDFVRFCGGDPSRYNGFTPPHLFSQWVLPVALRFAERLPYAPLAVVNLGCDLKMNKPLPSEGRVEVQCTLTHLEADDERAKITLGLATLYNNEAYLTSDLHLLVRLAKTKSSGAKRDRVFVSEQARELARYRLRRDAGLEFGQLTGDFNPIHWSRAYAKAVGFRGQILHGFAELSLALEALIGARLSGNWRAIKRVSSRFVAPLTLPHDVGVYWAANSLSVGDAAGGPAYMVAQVELE